MKRFTMTFVLLTLMALGVGPANAQSGHDLFQQALLKERAEGELPAAIQLYEQIVKDFATDRTLAARALVQMGQCYEKLGSTEAEKAYRIVVQDFADQPELVEQAEARLAALVTMRNASRAAEAERQPTFRKIEIASRPQHGILSPDGTTLAFASQGSLWLLPIHGRVDPYIAGEPVLLTERMGVRGITNMGNSLAWSGNGEWIAFNATPDEGPRGIHMIPARGGEPRKVPGIPWEGATGDSDQLSLSPGGRMLAFTHADTLEGSEGGWPILSLYSVPVEGGDVVRTETRNVFAPAYSPDGAFLAFARRVKVEDPATPSYQLWIMPVDGGAPILVADSTRVRYPPVWAPDSRSFAFIREPTDVSSRQEIWLLSITADGRPVGEPRVFSSPQFALGISGWTPEDELAVFMFGETRQALYTVPVEGGRAMQITPNAEVFHPRWTPDGETIAYRGVDMWLATVPAEGGESTEIEIVHDTEIVPAIPGGGVHISPDGRRILFSGYERGVQPLGVHIWTAPVEGGIPTQITDSPMQDRYPCWAPDGESITFLRTRIGPERQVAHNVYSVPSAGGEPRAITVDADSVGYAEFAYSPDGEWLAYYSNGALKIRPTEGGDARIVVRPDGVGGHSELAWSPDGRRIAYTGRGSIWITSVDGGNPVEVRTGVLEEGAQNIHIDWSPDGERLVFSASMGGEAELWMISDFLR